MARHGAEGHQPGLSNRQTCWYPGPLALSSLALDSVLPHNAREASSWTSAFQRETHCRFCAQMCHFEASDKKITAGPEEADRGLETGTGHGVSWQASPSPLMMASSQAHICHSCRHTVLSTAQGTEARRPHSDRSQMQPPGIPGKERWEGVRPSELGSPA